MRNKLHASDDMVYKALDEAKNEGSEAVGLYATGEPFLNKKSRSIHKARKKIGYKYVFVTTNGAAVTQKRIHKLLKMVWIV